jgi:ceramide glucosyltransferase
MNLETALAVYLGVHLAAQAVVERLATRAVRMAERAGEPGPASSSPSAPAPPAGPAPSAEAGSTPPVTLVFPVYGADRFTESCMRSWLDQRYDGPVQPVFALQDVADPALAVLDRLRAEYEFETVVQPVRAGLTGKSSNLLHGIGVARHERLVLCDDDILASPDTLARVVSLLEDGRDLVACLPSYYPRDGLPTRLYTLYWNMAIHYAWAPVTALGVIRGLWGCVVGVRRSALDRMGGYEELGAYLAEDLEMGRRAHRLGLRVALGPRVTSPVDAMTWSQCWRKFVLLSFVGFQQNPWGRVANAGFFLLFYGYLPAVILAAFLGAPALAAAALFLLGRGLLLGRLCALAEGRFRLPWEYPLMDVLHAAALLRVFGTGEVRWGETRYRAGPDGRIRAEG